MKKVNLSILQRDIPFSAVSLGLAIIIASILIGAGVRASRVTGDVITSTGSARQRVTADTAKLNGDITIRVPASDLKAGYARIERDRAKVISYLKGLGISDDSEITLGSVYSSEVWNNNNGPREYDIKQTVTIQSTDLERVKAAADNFNSLIQQDVLFQPFAVEYYYSKLPEMRRQLLGTAITDAKSRAEEIAKSAGNRIGELRSAKSGVVQVLAPNSVNVEDYGSYDTTTIEKDVVITVNATFKIK